MNSAKLILLSILQSLQISTGNIDANQIDVNEAMCLAQNIYYEARNEDAAGQYAVAHVTLNRVNDPRFPKTVCEVVKQAKFANNRKLQCAFSWYCENNPGNVPVKDKNGNPNQAIIDQFETASRIAIETLAGTAEDNTNGATYFHNQFVHPVWTKELIKTMKIGNHNFYKMHPVRDMK